GGTDGDLLRGLDGDDRLEGNYGADILKGNEGRDTLIGGSGADILNGGKSADVIYGGGRGDTIIGGNGKDKLFGDGGNDVIEGNRNRDVMTGGTGADTFVFRGDHGHDRIKDFDPAEDKLLMIGEVGDMAAFTGALTTQNGQAVFDFGVDNLNTIFFEGLEIADLMNANVEFS
ncbi:MAG: calcium-binding protein, partial [Pseudomonadota bacterium]